MKQYHICTKDIKRQSEILRVGDRVFLSGEVYTARDAAHKRMFEQLVRKEPLPVDLFGISLYYAGPTPSKRHVIGSCGPTTSARMDAYTPKMLEMGVACTIGKGPCSQEVCKAIKHYKTVYLCAVGGAGALASKHITACEAVAFKDLGCESIKRLQFDRFPLIVAVDSMGGNLFSEKISK